MAITKFTFPQVCKWYNSERREVVPAYQNTAGSNNYIEVKPTSYNRFSLDVSAVSATNPLEVDIFTYSNGIKIKLKITSASETTTHITCSGTMQLYDKNDNPISISGVPSSASIYIYDSKVYGDTINSVKLYYSPPQVMYSSLPHPDRFDVFGTYVYARDNASPYDAPELLGVDAQYGRANFGHYWNFSETPNINTDSAYDNLINGIIEKGDGTPISPIVPSEDISGVGGGDSEADYNPFSDPINFPDLPTGGSALASGFIKLYRPTSGELNQLASKLWSDSFIEEIKKIQNDPLEAIISLHSVPFGIVGASRQSCRIGNYDSEITMDTIGAQFYTVDCGNISIPEHWASALDYAPYTDIEIYLPFCGVKPLQIDDVMNRVLNVKYNIDILTGAAICMVKCGDSVLYTYNTEIAQNIPISASNHAQLYQSIISAASAVVGVASGGAGAVVGAVQSAATVAASKHSQVSRGGSLGGSVGVLGDFVPYLIIHRPIQSLAEDFAHKKGYPSNITATLSSVSGYTEVDSIHLENIPCTDMEREELYRILQEGVIL